MTATGETVRFGYDGDGVRVTRDTVTDTVVYVGSHYEVRFEKGDKPEDFDDDCRVSIADIQRVAARWRQTDQDAGWDGQYDLAADGLIDIFDIQQVANEWRETCHVPVETVKYYTLGGRRMAMRREPAGQPDNTLYYLFSDHLGSTSVVYDTSSDTWVTQRYAPYGRVRSGGGNALPTDYTFTGQRVDEAIGLMDYGARWYDPAIGRFVSADLIVPEPGNPQALNRYAYVYNNPLRYIDPSGYDPLDPDWQEAFRNAHGRDPEWQDRLIRLFSIAFPDEWDWSAFYDADGNYIERSLEKVFFTERPQNRSWTDIPDALERLAAWYDNGEEGLFTRDIGALFGGLKDRFEESSAWQAISFGGNPAHVWVYVNSEGLPSYLIGVDPDANIHHWAWGLVMGAEYGPGGSIINVGREITRFRGNWRNMWADVLIGNAGASLGGNFRLLGIRDIRRSWNIHMLEWLH